MDFGYLPPPPRLAHVVKAVWYARGSRADFDHAEPIVPDGCVELVFNLADPFEQVGEHGSRTRQPRDLLVGPTMQPTLAVPTGVVDLLGLRLRPGRTSAFLRTPMSDLTNQLVSISTVVAHVDRLLDDLRDRPVNTRLNHLTDALATRADESPRETCPSVALALAIIERGRGAVTIARLASQVGVSRRHLERQFRDEVGLSAKHVSRIARVQHTLRLMAAAASMTGADIAAHCGYADQAHLVRDFRELTGTTPSRLVTTTQPTFATLMRKHVQPTSGGEF